MNNKKTSPYKILTFILSLLYFSFLIYAVFFARRRHHLDKRYLNLVPVKNTINGYSQISSTVNGTYNFYSNLLGNIVLFMPLSFILVLVFRINKISTVLFWGVLLSIVIEIMQFVFEVGVADIDDIILNTLGTVIGFYCCHVFIKFNAQKMFQ